MLNTVVASRTNLSRGSKQGLGRDEEAAADVDDGPPPPDPPPGPPAYPPPDPPALPVLRRFDPPRELIANAGDASGGRMRRVFSRKSINAVS